VRAGETPTPRSATWLAFGGLALLGLALDQLTKQWAWTRLRGQDPLVVIDRVLSFDYAFNPGTAFGTLRQLGDARPFILATAVAAMVYMVVLVARMRPVRAGCFAAAALGLMFGGAAGNLLDRLLRHDSVRTRIHERLEFDLLIEHPTQLADALAKGRFYLDIERPGVVDFIVVQLGGERAWPAFNLADSWLVVGVGLLLLTLSRHRGLLDAPVGASAPG
jgi:signal peptidase II